MSTRIPAQVRRDEAGFSLLEVLISMTVMLLVLGGTISMMSNAMQAQKTAKDVLDMNGQLRAAMDLIQRDLLQVGQGLPKVGRRIGVPNGSEAELIARPGPAAVSPCPGVGTFPAVASIPAVTVGPGLGPPINGECTDVITILAADNMFGPVDVVAIDADGSAGVMYNSDNGEALRPGDLLMLKKNSDSVLMQVTDVAPYNNAGVVGMRATFGTGGGDPLGLNQFQEPDGNGVFSDNFLGTINRFKAAFPRDNDEPDDTDDNGQIDAWTSATRIRMVTYFVDVTTDPVMPRLVRAVGSGPPNAVGLGVQAFRISYDIANLASNPADVRMTAVDLTTGGKCAPVACSENEIRKVNVALSMKAFDGHADVGHYRGNHTQNTLFTQVSLRSLAFVDRYR